MKLLDVISAPWAIEPAKLLEIQAIYATHLRGEKIDLAGVEKRLGRPLDNQPKGYTVDNGVAVLPMDGVLSKRMNLMSEISGGTSTQLLARDLSQANADPAVHSIVLAIDSPGGTVDGTQTLADQVRASAKPTVAWASGTMASAAYWIGSAAQAIYIADSTTQVGSIGVVAKHTDISASEAAQGVKTTEITAGKYKRIASAYGPLTAEGKQSMQDQVDYTYGLFVDAVATHRGVSAEQVVSDMADGRIFIGQQAVDAGLVDGVSTLGALIGQLASAHASGNQPGVGPISQRKRPAAGVAATQAQTPTTHQGAAPIMRTPEDIAREFPEAAAALREQGASAERERIRSIEAQAIPGHEQLIDAMRFDGKSSAGDAALAIVAAEKAARQSAGAAHAGDAPAPVPAAPVQPLATEPAAAQAAPEKYMGFAVDPTSAALDKKARAHMAAHPGASYIDAVRAVAH